MVIEITSRADISLLVDEFYVKVRKNPDIGHFFNESILDWNKHLALLTDFWETNLLFKHKYKGNPKLTHQVVDKQFNESIEQKHFGIWLNLWFETIEHYFEAKLADRAKNNAIKMASHIFMGIYMVRNTN